MTEGFWWAALAVATASAAAHLVTMLGTRWGDRGVSTKAFLFSLMAHAALFCGLFAVGPKLDRFAPPRSREQDQPPRPITISDIRPEPGASSSPSSGDLPLWDRPSQTIDTPQDRTPRPSELPPVADAARTVEPKGNIERDLPPVAEIPDAAPAAPLAARGEVPELTTERAAPLDPEEETVDARAEDRPSFARTDLSEDARSDKFEPADRAPPPSADRTAPGLVTDHQMATLPNVDAPPDLPAAAADAPKIEAATAPIDVAPEPTADAADIGEKSPDSVASSRFDTRPTRSRDFSGDIPVEDVDKPDGDLFGMTRPSSRDRGAPLIDDFRPAVSGAPELSRPISDPPLLGASDGPAAIPETYQLRALEGRSDVARRNGGTEASEAAVESALAWLARYQNPAGYWDADAHGAGQVAKDEEGIDRKNAGKAADSGVTALAILAFHGAGYTRDDGPHVETVEKAIGWLVANQRADGYLGGTAANFEKMYCHGMATYALAEAYGMRSEPSDRRLRRPLEKAIAYLASQQGEDGGWRYEKGQAGDMSMFGWQLMALRSADIAGVPVPAAAKSKAIRFLKDRSLGDSGGLSSYLEKQRPTPSMTAEALFCKQMLGITRNNPASVEAVTYLLENAPRRSKLDFYYWYYGTLAMYQYGGGEWEKWNTALRDLLVSEQVKNGADAGSWEPRDAWGPYGGRVYSTAIAALSLEVYYRFLPLYRVGDDRPAARANEAVSRPNRTVPGVSTP